MSLEDIFHSLKTNYISREDDILNEVYIPCFQNSSRYYRGTAYFRTSVLELYRESVLDFCRFDGAKISILTSTEVMPSDAEDIILGYKLRDLELSLESLLLDEETNIAAKFVCALIASKKLDIHVVKGPLYHDKVGFFSDEQNNCVAFTGSGNETIPGISKNKNFERYVLSWSGHDSFSSYGEKWKMELTDAIDHGIYADAEIYRFDELSDYFMGKFEIPTNIDDLSTLFQPEFKYFNYELLSKHGPQPHQIRAFNGWKENSMFGFFEHATGTYKTATGLMCADEFLKTNDFVVISTPRMIISENWSRLVENCFNKKIRLVKCWSEHGDWHTKAINLVNSSRKTIFVFVNDSLWSPQGIQFLKILNDNFFLIADETHRWDVASSDEFLLKINPSARLALTAKLSEPLQEQEVEHILAYFADNLESERFHDTLDMPTALNEGFLRSYHYDLIKIIPSQNISGNSKTDLIRNIWNDFTHQKRIESEKLVVEKLENYNRVLAYTGPSIDDAIGMLEGIQNIWLLNSNLPGLFKKVTGRETQIQRRRIIKQFNLGDVRSLVAIKVLDEGVSLPISDVALMTTSSSSHRQWIQRRGRVLRKENPSDESTALVVDFILDISGFDIDVREQIINHRTSEIERTLEFAELSLNGLTYAQEMLTDSGWLL